MKYGRQDELNLSIPERAVIAGVGGVGYYVAFQLVLLGVNELHLFDADALEGHNLNRLPFPESRIGENKAELAKEQLEALRPEAFIYARQEWCSPDTLDVITEGCILFDCTDRLKDQKALKKWARENKVEYVRIGVNTSHISVAGKTGQVWTTKKGEEEERCGVTIPAYVPPCMIAAAYGVLKAIKNKKIERSEDVTKE